MNTITRVQISVGNKWYIRIKEAQCLCSIEIIEVTECTVLIQQQGSYMSSRYTISDIEFVERIK